MLTQILEFCRLDDQLVDLVRNIELIIWFEVTTRELLSNSVKNLDCPCILDLLDLIRDETISHAGWLRN